MKYLKAVVISLVLFYLAVSFILWDLQWFLSLQHMNALGRTVVLVLFLIPACIGASVVELQSIKDFEDDEVTR